MWIKRIKERHCTIVIHRNVLFVAIVCAENMCDLYWQVHDPESVDEILKNEIVNNTREFEYRMIHDIEWDEVRGIIKL